MGPHFTCILIWQEFKANTVCFSLSEVGISMTGVDRNSLNNNQLVSTKNSEFVIFFPDGKKNIRQGPLVLYSQ